MFLDVSTDVADYDTEGVDTKDPKFIEYWEMMSKQSQGWSGSDDRKKAMLQGKINMWRKQQEALRKRQEKAQAPTAGAPFPLQSLGMNNVALAALDGGLSNIMG